MTDFDPLRTLLIEARADSVPTAPQRRRLMMRVVLFVALPFFAAFSARADACSYRSPPVFETMTEVAAKGVLIRGQLIQAYDADKRQPEIIRADEIFIGDGSPRDFVIYRSKSNFQRSIRSRDPRMVEVCPPPATYSKAGQAFDRLVLIPADVSIDKSAEGKWAIHFWGGNVSMGRGLDMLVAEAKRLGRFKARPPKNAKWGDCMTCVTLNDR